MADFFVSYTSADQLWSEWIAYVLEEEKYSVIIQAWDFRPGSNFVLEMQKAATEANRTIMVLSPDYMKSQFASPEWAAAFAEDPQGLKRKLVPVVVRQCGVRGLLAPLVHINLVGVDEGRARTLLMDGLNDGRAKPLKRPSFPGVASIQPRKWFPGARLSDSTQGLSTYIPNVKRTTTDVEKRRFMRQAFDVIKAHFETALRELEQQSDGVECDFQLKTSTEFIAEIFLSGSSKCRCRIWQGGMLSSDGISYAEGKGHYSDNSCNESLSLVDDKGELFLTCLMGVGLGRIETLFNLKRMTQDEAADYLWRRFVLPLER